MEKARAAKEAEEGPKTRARESRKRRTQHQDKVIWPTTQIYWSKRMCPKAAA